MCGIAGIIRRSDDLPENAARASLQRAVEFLRHRGPDDRGVEAWPGDGVFLGHTRLSIIDLSAHGHQPMFNEDRTIAVVFNGEIYNFQKLRDELRPRHAFVSASDTEVLIHAYEEWGEEFVSRLEGMFAVALFDRPRSRVLLARDSIGIKPLYLLETPGAIAFASEARALLAMELPGWTPAVDMDAARRLLLTMYLPDGERTLIRGIRKLPAGHLARVEGGRVEMRPFWQLRRTENLDDIPVAEAVAETKRRLTEIVREHLIADVEVGVLLSGGLDSSLVAALAQRGSRIPLATFTAGFPHALDERPYARVVAEHIGSRHQEVLIEPSEAVNRIEEMIGTYDDLSTVDPGIVMVYVMAEAVRARGVKVLLVGEGGDEVFGGYTWYGVAQRPFRWLPAAGRAALCHYAVSRMLFRMGEGTATVAAAFRESGERDPFRQVQYWEIRTQLPNHYILKVDKATMAHGLEARVPFLDRRIVQWAYNLPARVLMPGAWWTNDPSRPKWLLRQVAADLLPPAITGRRKRGFSLPIHDVLQANCELVRNCLLAPDGLPAALLPEELRSRALGYRSSSYHPVFKQREFLVWKLFLMELWRRAVFGVSL